MAVVSSSGFSHADMLDEVPALRAFARRFYQNGPDAEDLVQDTLMRALANSDKFRAGTQAPVVDVHDYAQPLLHKICKPKT